MKLSQADIGARLAGNDLLGLLPEDERLALAAVSRHRQFERGANLYAPGELATHMYVIVTGRVKLTYNTVDGDEVVVEVYQADRETGATTLLDEDPVHFLYATAIEPALCICIPRAAFVGAAERNAAVWRHILTGLRRRIHREAQAAFLGVRGRVANKLIELAAAQSGPAVRISQYELAGLVAAGRPNVNRALAQLSREKVVVVARGAVSILDRERLSQIARERPRP
jgi:CRP-like cAMP-binding protein